MRDGVVLRRRRVKSGVAGLPNNASDCAGRCDTGDASAAFAPPPAGELALEFELEKAASKLESVPRGGDAATFCGDDARSEAAALLSLRERFAAGLVPGICRRRCCSGDDAERPSTVRKAEPDEEGEKALELELDAKDGA